MFASNEIVARFFVNGALTSLRVWKVSGREAISELFRFEIDVSDEDGALDLDACIGEPAHLTLTWGDAERHIDGIVGSFLELSATSEGARYRIELVPAAAMLDYGASCRVFSGISVPELISQTLVEYGVGDVRLSLSESYPKRDVLVQYRETPWAMLSRWMEAEGIHCFFEHREGGHTLVITDAPTTHDDIDGARSIAFRDEALDVGESVLSFELSRRIVPASVSVRDYPFDNPRGAKDDSASAKEGGKVNVFEFPASGPNYAKKRLEAMRAGEKTGRGAASSLRLAPGKILEIEGHPRVRYNADWLLTAVEHSGNLGDGGVFSYKTTFECAPTATPYRPPQRTPWPRILGAQMATVNGPNGSEIHTDADGRVLAVFYWDRGPSGAGTPVWLPVAHMAASQGFGAVSLPRVGDSVLVEFLDGDPARPVVTGRMYHKLNVHPYSLPANKTKTVLRDASSPGGDGYNELTFDSAAGAEEVYLRAQRNSRIEVQNDAKRTVGNDDSLAVSGDRTVSVTGENSRSVGKDESISITGSQSVVITSSQSVAVGGDQTITVTGDRALGVAGDLEISVEGGRAVAVEGDDELEVEGDHSINVSGSRAASIAGDDMASITGSRAESVEGDLQLIVDGQTFQSHGSLYVSVTGDTSFSYSGDVKQESATIQKIGAPKIYISAGTNLYLRAYESITLEVGDSKLTIEDGKVTVTDGGAKKTLTGDTIYMNC